MYARFLCALDVGRLFGGDMPPLDPPNTRSHLASVLMAQDYRVGSIHGRWLLYRGTGSGQGNQPVYPMAHYALLSPGEYNLPRPGEETETVLRSLFPDDWLNAGRISLAQEYIRGIYETLRRPPFTVDEDEEAVALAMSLNLGLAYSRPGPVRSARPRRRGMRYSPRELGLPDWLFGCVVGQARLQAAMMNSD